MAVFRLNINERVPEFYSGISEVIDTGSNVFHKNFSVGLDPVGSNIAERFIFTSYDRANHPQKYIHISVILEHQNFFFEYGGVRLFKNNSEITINISQVGLGDPIPGLLLRFIDYKETLLGRVIISVRATDSNDLKGSAVSSSYYAQNDEQFI